MSRTNLVLLVRQLEVVRAMRRLIHRTQFPNLALTLHRVLRLMHQTPPHSIILRPLESCTRPAKRTRPGSLEQRILSSWRKVAAVVQGSGIKPRTDESRMRIVQQSRRFHVSTDLLAALLHLRFWRRLNRGGKTLP